MRSDLDHLGLITWVAAASNPCLSVLGNVKLPATWVAAGTLACQCLVAPKLPAAWVAAGNRVLSIAALLAARLLLATLVVLRILREFPQLSR